MFGEFRSVNGLARMHLLEILRGELIRTMQLCGVSDIGGIGPDLHRLRAERPEWYESGLIQPGAT